MEQTRKKYVIIKKDEAKLHLRWDYRNRPFLHRTPTKNEILISHVSVYS